jgi:hypothetical protein
MYGLERENMNMISVSKCRGNDEYRAAVAKNKSNLDHDLKNNVLWVNLLLLLTQKEIVFNDEMFTITEAQMFLSDWNSADFVGKNFIFKLRILKNGEEKTLLVKATEPMNINKDQIATEASKLLGLPTYHVESYLGFELIEYLPHRLIMFSNQGFRSQPITTIKDFDAFIGVDPAVTQERMRIFGGILAVEYLLGAKDCQMKHVFFADNGGFPFRIDWEFLLDYSHTILGNVYPVLKGDEAKFIQMVGQLQNGPLLVECINQGFLDTLERARTNRDRIFELMRDHQIDVARIEADFTSRLDIPISIQDIMA